MMAVPTARRTLFSERRRAALGVGGVSMALLIMLALGGIFEGAMRQVTRYMDTAEADVYVAQRGVRNMHMSLSSISSEAVAAVRSVEGVDRVDPILFESSSLNVGDKRQLSYLIGFEPGRAGGPLGLKVGEMPREGEIVLDALAAENLGIGVGNDVVTLGRDWRVSGLTEGMTNITNTVAYVRFSDFQQARDLEGALSYLLVQTDDPAGTAQRVEKATGLEALTKDRFSIEERRIVQDMSADIMRIMTLSGLMIGLAVVVLVLYSATLSRLREIGIMKALGAGNLRLAFFVVLQSAWTVVPALGFAVLATLSLAGMLPLLGSGIAVWVSPAAVARVGLAAFALGAVGATAPLLRVIRVDPASVFKG